MEKQKNTNTPKRRRLSWVEIVVTLTAVAIGGFYILLIANNLFSANPPSVSVPPPRRPAVEITAEITANPDAFVTMTPTPITTNGGMIDPGFATVTQSIMDATNVHLTQTALPPSP